VARRHRPNLGAGSGRASTSWSRIIAATPTTPYTVRIADSVHVLHAFQKKSKSGIETPKPDVDLIERRLKAVLERHRSRDRS
jgi:phage-related protein